MKTDKKNKKEFTFRTENASVFYNQSNILITNGIVLEIKLKIL